MPIVSTPLLQAGADGTGFTTSSVSPTSGRLLQLTLFCASDVASPSVTGLSLTWTRIDDPSQFPNEPMQRWAAVSSGSSGAITFSYTGSGGGIGYILEEISGQAGTTVAEAYRDLGGGARATKIGPPFTPGDNIPAAFAAAANRASVAFSGTQFGNWAGGGTWNGGTPVVPTETASGLAGVTQTARSQTNPNISIDLIGALGTDGQASYGISWANGPFTARGIYSEIIAADEAPTGIDATIAEVSPDRVDAISAPVLSAVMAEVSPARVDAISAPVLIASVSEQSPARVDAITVAFPFFGVKTPYPFTIKQIHSGHSLTDPGFHPFPGPWIYMLDNVLGLTTDATIAKAVIPGSPLHYRWANESTLSPSARFDIDDWEALIITEGVPLPLDGSSETYLALYAANAWTAGDSGAGAPTLLFSTWTNIDNSDGPWRAMLDTYEPEWEGMADAATAALPPGAPPIFIIPGHRMMMRFYDDILAAATPPGIDNIADFFRDTIHLNDLGSYAWCMLHYACLFGVSPVGIPRDIWGPNQGWGDSPDTPEAPTIPTLEQATYIQETVWDVVTSYARTGVIASETVTVAEVSPTRTEAIVAPVLLSTVAEASPERVDALAAVAPSIATIGEASPDRVEAVSAVAPTLATVAEVSPARVDALSLPVVLATAAEASPERLEGILAGLVEPTVATIAETSPERVESVSLAAILASIADVSPTRVDYISLVDLAPKDVIARITATHTATARPATWSPDQ